MFLARLCHHLGHPSIKVTRALSSEELTFWQVVDQLSPFGDYRADLRAGVAADAIRGACGAKKSIGCTKYEIKGKGPAERQAEAKKRKKKKPPTAMEIGKLLGLKVMPNGG